MSQSDVGVLKKAIQSRWLHEPSAKAQRYVGHFFDQQRIGAKITAKVLGNHGTYTVSVQVDEQQLSSACSCYIGKHGYCFEHALTTNDWPDPPSWQEFFTVATRGLQSTELAGPFYHCIIIVRVI